MKIKDLAQEDLSGPSQIIFFSELNKFTGQWLTKFETRYYENEDCSYAIQNIFTLTGEDAHTRIYKAIKRLSTCLYSGPNFRKAMNSRR